jgi:hypothetical protein
MPEPVERFSLAKARVTSTIEVLEGKAYCFIETLFPPDVAATCPDVTIGFAPDGSRFGVYVNGHEVWPNNMLPTPDETINTGD